jgi:aldose 1-epimerase
MSITREPYGTTAEGENVDRITIEVGAARAVFLDLGARLLELWVPDKDGCPGDVVLGYPDVASHESGGAYFGATCGRYANRIRRGRFQLDGQAVQVSVNEGPNHLHGGVRGFDSHVWKVTATDHRSITFSLASPDGDQGFPGAADMLARYEFDTRADGSTTMDVTMSATVDHATVMNMVNHSYWNLTGSSSTDVLDHRLTIDADFYTPVDDELLPTGEVRLVGGTPFDFRESTPIGARIRDVDHAGAGRPSPAGFAGYDHNWVLRGQAGSMRRCVSVWDPASGRTLELWTNEPAVQFYTGGYLSSDVPSKHGGGHVPFQGFTLETQRFPDSPNIGHFPSARLEAGGRYEHRMHFVLGVAGDR